MPEAMPIKDLEKKLDDLKDSAPHIVKHCQDIATYCGVQPSTVAYWRDQERITPNRIQQLEELFALPPGTLLLSWSEFKEFLKTWQVGSSPWKRFLIEADSHSLLEICRPDMTADAKIDRIIGEDQLHEDPDEQYLHDERVYLKLALPAPFGWAKHAVILSKIGEEVRAVCPSELAPDMTLESEVTCFPKDLTGKLFKTTGAGLQTLITVVTAEPISESLTQRLNDTAGKLSEDLLHEFAVAVNSRPEPKRHVYRRDYGVVQLPKEMIDLLNSTVNRK